MRRACVSRVGEDSPSMGWRSFCSSLPRVRSRGGKAQTSGGGEEAPEGQEDMSGVGGRGRRGRVTTTRTHAPYTVAPLPHCLHIHTGGGKQQELEALQMHSQHGRSPFRGVRSCREPRWVAQPPQRNIHPARMLLRLPAAESQVHS